VIPKKVHIAWKTHDIIDSDSVLVKHGIKQLVELNPQWQIEISDDTDIELYLKNNLHSRDYMLLADKNIVEKCDVWRLIKLYNEGGLYVDIDRLCNISLDQITDNTKMILPTCLDYDFSHDFMCSDSNNPIYKHTLELNLLRRSQGCNNIYYLGSQTYFHAITKLLTGQELDTNPGHQVMQHLRDIISNSGFIATYKENPPYDTVIYKSNSMINFDHELEKRKLYALYNIKHWSGEW
jgi:mannosyltransferase OCH1-like enzyme